MVEHWGACRHLPTYLVKILNCAVHIFGREGDVDWFEAWMMFEEF